MIRHIEKTRPLGADEAAADRMLTVRTETLRASVGVDIGDQATGRLADTAKRFVCHGAFRARKIVLCGALPRRRCAGVLIVCGLLERIKSEGFAMALHFCIAHRICHRVLCFPGPPLGTTGRMMLNV
jgi:hypothetical protein